jgi:hypothetical protein
LTAPPLPLVSIPCSTTSTRVGLPCRAPA